MTGQYLEAVGMMRRGGCPADLQVHLRATEGGEGEEEGWKEEGHELHGCSFGVTDEGGCMRD